MHSLDASDLPERAVSLREGISLALMVLPLLVVLVFFLLNPSVWTDRLASFFSSEGQLLRSDPGWVISALSLAAATLSAVIGVLGMREAWKYNRRVQRGFVASVAAALISVLFGTWMISSVIDSGNTPEVGLAMFGTMCACLYGVVCAAVSPRDLQNAHFEEPVVVEAEDSRT